MGRCDASRENRAPARSMGRNVAWNAARSRSSSDTGIQKAVSGGRRDRQLFGGLVKGAPEDRGAAREERLDEVGIDREVRHTLERHELEGAVRPLERVGELEGVQE